jgi:hypothetical protein
LTSLFLATRFFISDSGIGGFTAFFAFLGSLSPVVVVALRFLPVTLSFGVVAVLGFFAFVLAGWALRLPAAFGLSVAFAFGCCVVSVFV